MNCPRRTTSSTFRSRRRRRLDDDDRPDGDAAAASREAEGTRDDDDDDDDIDWRDDDDGGGGGEEGGAIERATKTKNADRGGITSASSSSSYSPRGGDGIAPAWRASDCVALAEVKAHHGKDAEALVLFGRALDALRVEKGDAHDDTLACAKRVATALRKVADASSRAELEDVVVFAHDALVARHGAKDARTPSDIARDGVRRGARSCCDVSVSTPRRAPN